MSLTSCEVANKSSHGRKCDSCSNDFKYRCPACNIKSCSLECVNSHKSKTGCDGNGIKKHIERNITISEYNGNDMWRDFNFLEDTRRRIANASREQKQKKRADSYTVQHSAGFVGNITRRGGGGSKVAENQGLVTVIKESSFSKSSPIPLLKKACTMRKIKIIFCPVNEMQIRMNNTSYYNKKGDLLSWKMEFYIHSENNSIEKKYMDSVSEAEIVADVVLRLINSTDKSMIKGVFLLDNFKDEQSRLPPEVDINKSFKENLIGRKIIEFPRFKVDLNV
ncbi:cysteine-rich domain-like protein [Cryptosporidium canis]|uniref:Cysteine-rich domain-like protein n=1 Tax=Cryptosporidium canis TaxID=195482 RepID=A0A9D5HVS7_9CRYT|nr:cysteine-rich domain-like protein [Cryptosporidium canis]